MTAVDHRLTLIPHRYTLTLLLCCGLLYLLQRPIDPANGDTALGYSLGIIAALISLLLMALGAVKRQWLRGGGSYQSWLQVHLQAGLTLFFISGLHSGWQLGWNIHSASFMLMTVVVISGLYGANAYQRFPQTLQRLLNDPQQQDSSLAGLLTRINQQERHCLQLAKKQCRKAYSLVHAAIQGCDLPRHRWQLLRLRDRSQLTQNAMSSAEPIAAANSGQSELHKQLQTLAGQRLDSDYRELLQSCLQRSQMLDNYRQALQLSYLMRLWLGFHLSLSLVFVSVLISHILLVLLY